MSHTLNLETKVEEVLKGLGRHSADSQGASLSVSNRSFVVTLARGPWWGPKIRASLVPSAQGCMVHYAFEPEFIMIGLWIALGFGFFIFGTIGFEIWLDSVEGVDRVTLTRQVVWGAAAVYLATSLYFAFRAVTCAPKVERALVDLLTPFGLQGEGAQVAINGLLTCQVPPDRFLQQLAKVLSGQTGPSHRFQGQVQGNCFSFRVPGLQALRATEVHHLFQGTVSSSDQQTSQIRWSLGGTGIRWHEEVAAVVGVTIVLVLVKVPLLLALGTGMAGMAVRWLLAASLIADQLKGLEEEAAILLQWCADHS